MGTSETFASAIGPDAPVSFVSGGITVHGSLRGPVPGAGAGAGLVPAALIIAGSGPTDRDGNSHALPGVAVDTNRWLADQFSAAGFASLRYDKLGSGQTGLGDYTPETITGVSFQDGFEAVARAAYGFLAARPGIDPGRLMIVGHSEGGMLALAVATHPGTAPAPARLMLVEPQYAPILDPLETQLADQLDRARDAGAITAPDAGALRSWLAAGIAAIRAGDPVPDPLVPPLPEAAGTAKALQDFLAGLLYNPGKRLALRTEDQIDPKALAAGITRPGSVLLTCGTKDDQTPCHAVAGLADAFPEGVATLVSLPDTIHTLRDVGDADPATLTMQARTTYPFSQTARTHIATFLAEARG